MSHKTCFAACAIVCLTVFALVGCSGVDPYRSVDAGPVGADAGSLIGDLFVIIAILAALVLIAGVGDGEVCQREVQHSGPRLSQIKFMNCQESRQRN